MKINAKFHCGIKTLIELANNSDPNGLMQKEISLRQDISIKFLDQIISALKTAGLIHRVGGKSKGGYKLLLHPAKITVYQIYRAFEPEMYINPCLIDESICKRSPTCGAHCFLKDYNEMMKKYMLSRTLLDLLNSENEKSANLSA